jgi:hypothetical protein
VKAPKAETECFLQGLHLADHPLLDQSPSIPVEVAAALDGVSHPSPDGSWADWPAQRAAEGDIDLFAKVQERVDRSPVDGTSLRCLDQQDDFGAVLTDDVAVVDPALASWTEHSIPLRGGEARVQPGLAIGVIVELSPNA